MITGMNAYCAQRVEKEEIIEKNLISLSKRRLIARRRPECRCPCWRAI